MGGEPWCFTPAEIGKLTDHQVWEIYVRPAVRRSRQARGTGRRKRKGSDIPGRAAYIAMGVAFGGAGTEEHWAKEYDAWAASEEGQRVIAEEAAKKKARRKRR